MKSKKKGPEAVAAAIRAGIFETVGTGFDAPEYMPFNPKRLAVRKLKTRFQISESVALVVCEQNGLGGYDEK